MVKRKGIIFVISAPSGAGKTTLIKKLLSEFNDFVFSISYTTRTPRVGEINGVHYHFVTEDEFKILVSKNFFAEYAVVHNEYYGTPLETTNMLLDEGKDVLFDIDVQGAIQLQSSMEHGFYVFILPPSYTILRKRLEARGTDGVDAINLRMKNAKNEICNVKYFNACIVNDNLEKAYDDLRSAYIYATLSPASNTKLLENIMMNWK